MSSWSALSIAVPLSVGLGLSFNSFRRSSSSWHNQLRKPKYNIPHRHLLPVFAGLYTIQGLAAYLASNEMMLSHHTPEYTAVRAGQLGLGFYWLGLTFLAFWPMILASSATFGGWGLRWALVDLVVAVGFEFLAMVQFFRLGVGGGLMMLACFLVLAALALWNAALVQASGLFLPY
ncbi:hypothetical protein BX661DRAFT_200341 [Kickxella alabastrina]|uniref:uncharacterized protein n=1 Tax=Kickxella alabastrina TaxID=61397 RepID=UPI0022211065|nr:uncharacterized protein BX661DRAFT_200341 [Kickxella alabastrina]KAI7822830.1 hypothetical protein BX661DRAFT_200341 [Kickxella alabastrina]